MAIAGHKRSEETRRRIGETRKARIADGSIRNENQRIRTVPSIEHIPHNWGMWMAGFTDGEGCFSVRRTAAGGIQLQFRLTVRDDDEAIIEEMPRMFRFGAIYRHRTKTCGAVGFNTCSFADAVAIANFFDKFPLRSKKRRDFECWARIARKCHETYFPKYADFKDDLWVMNVVKHGPVVPIIYVGEEIRL